MDNLKAIAFSQIPVGTEFWWGGWKPSTMNWGKKRSSRTADFRPRLCGVLSERTTWSYFKDNETVFISI